MGQHDQNTVQRFRRSGVNPDRSSPGDRCLDRIKISRLRHGLLIRVQGCSSDFRDPVQPSKADTDRLTMKAGAHGFCSRPARSPPISPSWRRVRSASNDATVLRTMVILNALSLRVTAWAELDIRSVAEVLHTRGRAAQGILSYGGAPRFVSNSTERDPDVSNGRAPRGAPAVAQVQRSRDGDQGDRVRSMIRELRGRRSVVRTRAGAGRRRAMS